MMAQYDFHLFYFIISEGGEIMKNSEKTKRLVLASAIVAIIILMGFTPIGYIKTVGIEVTFLMIPVVIGASVLGKEWGTIFLIII